MSGGEAELPPGMVARSVFYTGASDEHRAVAMLTSNRGFLHAEPVVGDWNGEVYLYQSSLASDQPYFWLRVRDSHPEHESEEVVQLSATQLRDLRDRIDVLLRMTS